LIREGTISPATLVWREGMEKWQPLSEVRRSATTPGVGLGQSLETAPPLAGTVVCSQCGKAHPAEQTIQVADRRVCAECKPLYLQKLREGVSTQPDRENLERILAIAKAQKGVIWCILAVIVCYAGMFLLGGLASPAARGDGKVGLAFIFVPQLAALVVLAFQIVFVYRLAAALQVGVPLLWVVGVVCLSCIGLLLMLILSSRATKAIRAAGFKVGIMGANLREIQAAM
jgi:hypothetical protein